MIYLKLRGRIGNQLFMYAAARSIQIKRNDEIVIEDAENIAPQYVNSLVEYPLLNVRYVHDYSEYRKFSMLIIRTVMWFVNLIEKRMPYNKIWIFNKKVYPLLRGVGILHLQDGYVPLKPGNNKNIYLDGFFQSELFFEDNKEEIKNIFRLSKSDLEGYPSIEKIENRNTVCISIKVQHNVGNPMYDVCNMGYYEKAIKYITEHVENPLFMICSDNVQYVKDNLIDTDKYECVEQAKDFPVHISLAAMARCKHFIIGNTSFGWWAQYLGDYSEKIVVAPSRWYGIDMPRDIYQDSWVQIEV